MPPPQTKEISHPFLTVTRSCGIEERDQVSSGDDQGVSGKNEETVGNGQGGENEKDRLISASPWNIQPIKRS